MRGGLLHSPFRLIGIDDPVQSIDPVRVNGLARVLEEEAAGCQVAVFRHDGRLPRACRLLSIDANVLEVHSSCLGVRMLTPQDSRRDRKTL